MSNEARWWKQAPQKTGWMSDHSWEDMFYDEEHSHGFK